MDFARVDVHRRDDQPRPALTELPLAKDLLEFRPQLLLVVFRRRDVSRLSEPGDPAEDARAALEIEVADLSRAEASTKAEGDYAPCRRADDEVEVIDDVAL